MSIIEIEAIQEVNIEDFGFEEEDDENVCHIRKKGSLQLLCSTTNGWWAVYSISFEEVVPGCLVLCSCRRMRCKRCLEVYLGVMNDRSSIHSNK